MGPILYLKVHPPISISFISLIPKSAPKCFSNTQQPSTKVQVNREYSTEQDTSKQQPDNRTGINTGNSAQSVITGNKQGKDIAWSLAPIKVVSYERAKCMNQFRGN
jgi:hypothetical protein